MANQEIQEKQVPVKDLKKINIQEGIRKGKAEKRVITGDNFNNNYLKHS